MGRGSELLLRLTRPTRRFFSLSLLGPFLFPPSMPVQTGSG